MYQAQYTLIYMGDEGISGSIPLRGEINVGSSADADLQITSGMLAPKHFSCNIFQQEVYVTDLGAPGGLQINGQTIPANQPVIWRTGQTLTAGNMRFELRGEQAAAAVPFPNPNLVQAQMRQSAAAYQQFGYVQLVIEPNEVKLRQRATLFVRNAGTTGQQLHFRVQPDSEDIDVLIEPPLLLVHPGQQVEVNVMSRPKKSRFLGGKVSTIITALSPKARMVVPKCW